MTIPFIRNPFRRKGRGRKISAALIVLASLAPGSALAFGDSDEGAVIARRWCAACHVVSPDQARASTAVPTFAEITKRYDGKMKFLEAFLSESHPGMPDMNLTYREIQNLVAYFEGL